MNYYNFYDKKQDQRTMSLPDAHWSEYMYTREWANKMSFESFKKLLFQYEKSDSKKHFYEWVESKTPPPGYGGGAEF